MTNEIQKAVDRILGLHMGWGDYNKEEREQCRALLRVAIQEGKLWLPKTVLQMANATAELVEKHFPKGKCQERGEAIVMYAEMLVAIQILLGGEEWRKVIDGRDGLGLTV